MTSRRIVLCLASCLLILAGETIRGEEKPAPKVPKVAVAHPVVREISDYEDFTGRVEAAKTVELRARITGTITKVAFKAGTTVKKGDLLFEIDARAEEAKLKKVEAELPAAEAKVTEANRRLEVMKSMRSRFSNKRTQMDDEIALMVKELHSSKVSLAAAEGNRDIVKLNLAASKVTAPIAGKITQPAKTEGNCAIADSTILATIYSVDPIHVAFDVPQRTGLYFARMKPEARAKALAEPIQLALADEKDWPRRGKVEFTGVRVDPEKGTIRWQATFPNKDGLLLPGMFARVRLTTSDSRKALLIPEESIFSSFDLKSSDVEKGVYVVNAKKIVERRIVTLGRPRGDLREITKGLDAKDRVVLQPNSVNEGMTVQPEEVAPEKPSSAVGKYPKGATNAPSR